MDLEGVLTLEHHRPLSSKTGFFVGAGGQYTNFEDQSIIAPCEFLNGDKVVLYNTSEFYKVHRTDLTLSLGLEHRIGKFSLRGILLPTILLDDKIDARIILDFISPNRPAQEQEFTIKPGERVNFEGAIEYTVDYSDKVQRQREIGFSYAIEKQLWFGIAYRHGLSQYESISLIPG